MIVLLCLVAAICAYIFVRWFVSIPVGRAVYEITDAAFRRESGGRIVTAPDADLVREASEEADSSEPSPLCESGARRFIDAYHTAPGTWRSQSQRAPDESKCELKCSNDNGCSGYAFDSSRRICNLIPSGADKLNEDGSSHLRAAATDWTSCTDARKAKM
jgi:hypothetical protein